MKIILSVVVPIFNESGNINQLYSRLNEVLRKISREHEIIFINDGSSDNSLALLKKIRRKDKKIKIISFSRNFGHMAAVDAGLTNAKSEWVIVMDGDLQDPPEVIPKMLVRAKEGFDVVYGVKKKRKEGVIKRTLFSMFYRLFDMLSPYKMPANAGTFSLMNKKVVKLIVSLPEKNKFVSGLRAWTGFSQVGVEYERSARHAGEPASLKRLTKLALDGIISFSYIPLRIASILGFIFATFAFLAIIGVFVLRIFFGFGIVGWASTMSAVLFVGGIQLITLGIIGEYLARIYDEVKNRPKYIISEKLGFK